MQKTAETTKIFNDIDNINCTVMGLMEDLDPEDDEAGKADIDPDSGDLFGEIRTWKQKYPNSTGVLRKVLIASTKALNAVDDNDYDTLSDMQASIQTYSDMFDPTKND